MQLIQRKQSTFLTSLVSVLLGMLVGAVMMLVAGYDPIKAYGALLSSAFLMPYDIGKRSGPLRR